MALEELTGLITSLGKVGLWLQAIGIIAIIWIIFMVINWFINKKRLKTLYSLKGNIERIEKKIDKIIKK